MPVIPIDGLLGGVPSDRDPLAMTRMLAAQPPGIVLTTGQAQSGKLTIAAGLADMLATRAGLKVVVLGSSDADFETFRPLPPAWRELRVGNASGAWESALRTIGADEIAFVAAVVDRDTAPAIWRSNLRQWLVASLDTPLLGPDVAYPLLEMGISLAEFTGATRCVWSQFLVWAACRACLAPAALSPAELEHLIPSGNMPRRLLTARGCPECNGRGTQRDRYAATEVLLINDDSRALVEDAFENGTALAPDAAWHVTVHDQTWCLLDEGAITVETYRDAVRRNPLLRAQNTLDRERAHSHRLASMFEKFVSPEVKRRLMDGRALDSIAAGETREITCMFCDIRGFTTRAESRDPAALFAELNLHFSGVVDCVLAHEGTIDKFIGDAVMVVWGAPLDQPDHARRAIACALELRGRVDAFNRRRRDASPILIGIGINSGHAAAGCIGTQRRMEYTVLGDAVNTAARLESRARPGQILVSMSARNGAGDGFAYGPEIDFDLKGKKAAVRACEVIGMA